MPGKIAIHQLPKSVRAAISMVPHVTSSAAKPKPINDKKASSKTPLAMPKEKAIRTGVKTLGKACRKIMRMVDAPMTSAASMNSSCRIRIISPRTKRVKLTQLVMPINKIRLAKLKCFTMVNVPKIQRMAKTNITVSTEDGKSILVSSLFETLGLQTRED